MLRRFWEKVRVYVYVIAMLAAVWAFCWVMYHAFLGIVGDVAHVIKDS